MCYMPRYYCVWPLCCLHDIGMPFSSVQVLEDSFWTTDHLSVLRERSAFAFFSPEVTTAESPKNVAESSMVNGGVASQSREGGSGAAQQVPVPRKKLLKAPTLAELDSSDSEVRPAPVQGQPPWALVLLQPLLALLLVFSQYNWVTQSCPALCDPLDCSTLGFLVHHQLLGACSNSCPLSWWCHPTISSSVFLFSCLQSFPASESFQWISSSHQVAKVLELQHQVF